MKFNIEINGKRYGVEVVEKMRKHEKTFFRLEFKRTKGIVRNISECGDMPRDLESFLSTYPELACTFSIGESVFMEWGTGHSEPEKEILSRIPGTDWRTHRIAT